MYFDMVFQLRFCFITAYWLQTHECLLFKRILSCSHNELCLSSFVKFNYRYNFYVTNLVNIQQFYIIVWNNIIKKLSSFRKQSHRYIYIYNQFLVQIHSYAPYNVAWLIDYCVASIVKDFMHIQNEREQFQQ
jgi:hypothetical protein